MSTVIPYHINLTAVLYNGDWGDITRPYICEITIYSHRYRGEYNNYYNMRRGIRISVAADSITDGQRDYFLQDGALVLSMEVIAKTYEDLSNIIRQIRTITREYKRQNDYAEIIITEFNITPKSGKYIATAGVSAYTAANAP